MALRALAAYECSDDDEKGIDLARGIDVSTLSAPVPNSSPAEILSKSTAGTASTAAASRGLVSEPRQSSSIADVAAAKLVSAQFDATAAAASANEVVQVPSGRLLSRLPAPAGGCSQEVENRFADFLRLSSSGRDFTAAIRARHDFGNPLLIDHAISAYGISPLAVAGPIIGGPDAWNPDELTRESSDYKVLADMQDRAASALEASRASRQALSARLDVKVHLAEIRSLAASGIAKTDGDQQQRMP